MKAPIPRLRIAPRVLLCLTTLSLASCGQQAYVPVSTTAAAKGAGGFLIPPKADILIVQDDTGSTYEIENALASNLSAFVTGLDGETWDYRLATVPLTHDNTLSQIVASKYDGNWSSLGQWQAPYPGASPGAEMVNSSYFRTPANYSGFFGPTPTNANDWGLENIRFQLTTRLPGTGFLRNDAMLVVLVVTNGEDSSRINFCKRSGDGLVIPCSTSDGYPAATMLSQTPDSSASASQNFDSRSFTQNYYLSQFQNIKPNPSMFRFYAAVGGGESNCLGGPSFFGSRYYNLANLLGGKPYDICNTQLSTVLSDLESQLQSIRLQFQTHYIFIAQDADPASITVTKYSGGSPSVIPQDSANGWTYAGYLTGVYTIDYPIQMNQASGYAIELHGSAKLVGDDTATVDFKPAGLQPSH